MTAILLDVEPLALRYLQKLCMQVPNLEVLESFDNAPQAIEAVLRHKPDLLLTDIEMPGVNGLETVRALREIDSQLGVIFVTGHEAYAFQAFQMDAVAYLMKPCKAEDLAAAVKKASRLASESKMVSIRTFGYFAVSISGVPVRFANKKAKELLALLVDRNGSVVTMEQAVDILWEERAYDETVKRLYRKAIGYLHQTFLGTNFFVSDRGSCHIVPEKAECDYFTVFRSPRQAAALYGGDYLLDYSWGEPTNAKITNYLEQYAQGV